MGIWSSYQTLSGHHALLKRCGYGIIEYVHTAVHIIVMSRSHTIIHVFVDPVTELAVGVDLSPCLALQL